MKQLSLDTRWVLFTTGIFVLAYLFTFPMGWLVSDVYSYMNQGIAIANGQQFLSYTNAITHEEIPYSITPYPLGNAIWIAFWIKLVGLKHVYLGSLISIILGTYFIYRILIKEGYFRFSILLIFIYPSLAFFSNTLMSAMPSFLLVSAFLYALFQYQESGQKWFILSCIAALSFWIRETNLVFLGGICLTHFIQDRKWLLYYAGGALLGFLPRLLTSYYYYDDPFYYVLAESFSFQNIVKNIGVYGILLLVFMPLGAIFMAKYKGKYSFPILTSSLLFVIMYLCYSFNATSYSGYQKGVILMGRFMIPILPVFIISVGYCFRNKSLSPLLKASSTIIVSILIIVMQVYVYKEAKIHKQVSDHIYTHYTAKMVLFDLSRTTNIVRYINPFHGELSYGSDISNLNDDEFMQNLFEEHPKAYLIQTINTANTDKEKMTSIIDDLIVNAKLNYQVTEKEKVKIKPKLYLQILEIEKGKYSYE